MPDILAIVSKAIFERDGRVGGKLVGPGDLWPADRYTSTNKALAPLVDGGRLFLVTVRPGSEALWLVAILDNPRSDGSMWKAAKNSTKVTDISALRKTIKFESGKGISQEKGTLGMSLQTPRILKPSDVTQIYAAIGGKAPSPVIADKTAQSPPDAALRVIDGKYQIVRPLGEGGMGMVYEARNTKTGRRVALKEILGDKAMLLDRFNREVRATGAIESQHIAAVLDSGSDEHPYLVMELLRGEDLKQVLARRERLPQDVAIRTVAQACIGLARAHEAGVIHRDIKPANMFLSRREDDETIVKLLDFGIARVREELMTPEDRGLTSTGLMLGTPLYMSPEQVQGSKKLDHRTDIWSLGIVLYEALSGRTPHSDVETMGALYVAICSKPARPLAEVAPHVRASIAPIVKKALALDPNDRYATAEEFLSDLKKEVRGELSLPVRVFDFLPEVVGPEVGKGSIELDATLPAPATGPDKTLRSKE